MLLLLPTSPTPDCRETCHSNLSIAQAGRPSVHDPAARSHIEYLMADGLSRLCLRGKAQVEVGKTKHQIVKKLIDSANKLRYYRFY
jgi:hypothetical protein